MASDSRTISTNFLLVIASTLVTLLLIELGGRIYYGEWRIVNFHTEEQTLFASGYPAQFDTQLGWVPKPGFTSNRTIWGTKVSIDENGIRSNGNKENPPSLSVPVVLTVGDSFTFGDEVSDHETWPAVLERLTSYKVLNGGVFGYGVDQSFLRMEDLTGKHQPDIVIFSLIAEDIQRCELSLRTAAHKPYFDLHNGRLVRFNDPVPRPYDSEKTGMFKKVAGYSIVVHELMMKIDPGQWLKGKNWLKKTKVHSKGEQVACELMRNLSLFKKNNNLDKIIVLVQYWKASTQSDLEKLKNVLKCIDKQEVQVVDIYQPLFAVAKNDRARFEKMFNEHMTYEGNKFVAEILAEYLQ